MMTSHSKILTWSGKAVGVNQRNRPIIRNNRPVYIVSKKYRNFINDMARQWLNKNKPLTGYVSITIYETINAKRDIDSLAKPILDALQKANIIKNDNKVLELKMKKIIKHKNDYDYIIVIIEKYDLEKIKEVVYELA